MQLIVDTDTDISFPRKMSTIQQESLNEKFINTSLIPNLCKDITDIKNGNEKCVKNEDIVVKECEENVKATDQNAQHTETNQETINDKCEELGLCDKESTVNKEYGKTENIQNAQIEDKIAVQDKVNYEIAVDAPVEEKNVIEVHNKDYKNNSDIHNKSKQESIQDCGLDKKELINTVMKDEVETEKQVNNKTENNKVETQDDMIENKIEDQSNSDIENNVKNPLEMTSETGDKIEKPNHKNVVMDIANEEHYNVDSSKTSVKVLEPVEVNHEIEHKSEKQNEEHIEMDVEIGELTDVTSIVKEDTKFDCGDKPSSRNTEKQNEEHIEMDVEIGEHTDVTSSVKEDIKVDSATEVMIVDQVIATDTKDEQIRQGIADSNEMDVTNDEQENINISVIADNIERQVEVTKEIEDKCEKQNVENMELDVTIDKQDEIDGSIAQDAEQVEVAHKIEDKCENRNEASIEMDVTNEEKDKVTSNDNINEDVKLNIATKNQVKVTKEKEDDMKKTSEAYSEMDVTFEEQDKVSVSVTDNKIEKRNEENSEIQAQVEQQDHVNPSVKKDTVEVNNKVEQHTYNKVEQHTYNVSVLEKGKGELDAPGYLNSGVTEDEVEKQSKDNNETKVKLDKLFNESNEMSNEREDQLEEQQNEISAIINKLEEESQVIDNIIEQVQNKSESEDKQSTQISVKKDITPILDDGSMDNSKTSPCMEPEKEIDNNRLDSVKTLTSLGLLQIIHQSEVISQEVGKHESKRKPENVENKTKVDDENTVQKLEMQDSNDEKSSNTIENNTESAVTQMDTMIDGEVIDIADEKDDEDEKGPKNTVKMDSSIDKAESALKNEVQESKSNAFDVVDLASHNKSDPEIFVKEAKVDHADLKKPVTEVVGEKKKLIHISKLSNTLDILSDEEEDLPKEAPLKQITATDRGLTSIDIDDDDDIMLIDEESSPKNNNNQTESTPESINEIIVKEDSTVELNEKKEDPLCEISENNKDTIQAEVATPSITETKVSEPKPDLIAQEEPSTPKKTLLQPNFLKTCKKNLADMTRDELEEFCILKIVESVVDRSNLSEIKSQFKALAQNIEEYKKKASVLTKQNRDLQVVLKSVQEEQKKKSNMPITPLKITRSVGMQVLMTDKVGARKKTQNHNTTKSNAGAKSGPRQGKTAQNNARVQKTVTNTSNNSPIPVPRLVPAINSSNLNNNMKLQPSPANASGKSQITGPVNKSPVQSLSNGLPAASPVQKPEKRPHSRMQQNDSVTVDLTDDEPPTKVISRNVTPPVRLVPPQNLLAPNRQPFVQNVGSPRKVYIPISGTQTPVGVKQTIMLRTISPQGPRQRAPTPGLTKPNQSSNAIRIQRVPSRHPAPLPESVKQYQPQNWKALPPAPELKLAKVDNGIVISWKIDGYEEENHEEIASYQLYAYQETTSPPSTALWKKIGDVKALALPMACTLTQFMAGYKYYFAVRAVDIKSRLGPFSLPGSILLFNKI